MKELRKIPAWPSLILVAIITAVFSYLRFKPDLSECSFLTIVLAISMMNIGLFFIWTPYVIQTYSITSTWKDVVDERRFRIIGYVILIVLLIAVLFVLYDYQSQYQDRNEVYYERDIQKIINKQ